MDGRVTVSPGQTWECYEGRADDPEHDWPGNPFGDRYVRFHAIVDEVHGGYVAMTVTRRNRHISAPEPTSEVATSAETLRNDPRWQRAE